MASSIVFVFMLLRQPFVGFGADTASAQFASPASWVGKGSADSFKGAVVELFTSMSSHWIVSRLSGTLAPNLVVQSLPEVPLGDDWESRFIWGVYYSKLAIDGPEVGTRAWVADTGGSGSGVPKQMLRAEELLESVEEAPAEKQKAKRAELALRIYYHAKWLAERNIVKAAEWRYREASRLARETGRKVLAAHALSRLGYFLASWNRRSEAREVLRDSERLSKKTNPLAPFLYGVLERQVAGPDIERLRAAEERIMSSETQPSEDLERDRQTVMQEISYWRSAELSPRECFSTQDSSHAMICLSGHLFGFLRKVILAEA